MLSLLFSGSNKKVVEALTELMGMAVMAAWLLRAVLVTPPWALKPRLSPRLQDSSNNLISI